MSEQALSLNAYSNELLNAIDAAGLRPNDCYQCGRCSSGCPIAAHFDIKTMDVVRLAALGMEEPLMESHAIWLCAGCETCTTRCPNDIDIAHLMDTLREYSIKKGYKPAEQKVAKFHKTYLNVINRHGRIFEVELFAEYKMRSMDLFSDMAMGMKMFFQGKLGLFPHRIKNRAAIKKIYKDAKEARKNEGREEK